MFHGKPVIGIIGGIGSGKSYVARMFGELGCMVIDSDALVREVYEDAAVRELIRQAWGNDVLRPDGSIDRSALARKVFSSSAERQRLEGLIHPLVDARRRKMMESAGEGVRGFVWDSPLLVETGLNTECDAVVFVDAPTDLRVKRVAEQRGWDAVELARREKLQLPLDRKRKISDYLIVNTAGADDLRGQIRQIFSRITSAL